MRISDDASQPTPVFVPEETENLCEAHGFRNCSVCIHDDPPSPASDGFREWLDANSAGMEGEDDTESLMHVSWRAALLRYRNPVLGLRLPPMDLIDSDYERACEEGWVNQEPKLLAMLACRERQLHHALTAQPAPLPSDDDDNFTAAARFAGITPSQGCQLWLMMQHLLGNGPAPGFLPAAQPASLPSDQKETFEQWWDTKKESYNPRFVLGLEDVARAAWNAAKGGTN